MAIIRSNRFGLHRTTIVPSPTDVLVALQTWLKLRTKRAQMRALLLLDTDQLTDMGLTRGDVHEALSEQGDPCANLRALASQRRAARNW